MNEPIKTVEKAFWLLFHYCLDPTTYPELDIFPSHLGFLDKTAALEYFIIGFHTETLRLSKILRSKTFLELCDKMDSGGKMLCGSYL